MTQRWPQGNKPRRCAPAEDHTETPPSVEPARGRRAMPEPELPRHGARRGLASPTFDEPFTSGWPDSAPSPSPAQQPVETPPASQQTPPVIVTQPIPVVASPEPANSPSDSPAEAPSPSTETTSQPDEGSVEAEAVEQPADSKDKLRLPLVITIVILTLALIAAGWVIINQFSRRDDSTPTQPSASPTLSTASPDPESTEGAQEPVAELVLNDTSLTAPSGWNLYGDEQIESDRRVIRLSHGETDVRLQVVSLTSAEGDLNAACEALSASQQEQFSDVTTTPTLSAGVNPDQGAGVTCGFQGTRLSDGVTNTVSFTLLLRVEDGHVLLLRSMIPSTVTPGAVSRQELAAMNCTASLNFGVTLPLC